MFCVLCSVFCACIAKVADVLNRETKYEEKLVHVDKRDQQRVGRRTPVAEQSHSSNSTVPSL